MIPAGTARPAPPHEMVRPAFDIAAPIVAFTKSSAPVGQQKRIAGIISTDNLDQQKERLIQDGLNFDTFLKRGWLNNNHSNESVCDVVGYPDKVTQYKKGDELPNGQTASANCTWAEGYLIGHKGAEIWNIAKDLEGSSRCLGFSVEGTIGKRDAKDRNLVLSADVTNVAITHCPVNTDAKLELLARSLSSNMSKMLSFGPGAAQGAENPLPQPIPGEAAVGEGAGRILTEQFPDPRKTLRRLKKKRKKKTSTKSLTRSEALSHIEGLVPGISKASAVHILKTALAMADNGLT